MQFDKIIGCNEVQKLDIFCYRFIINKLTIKKIVIIKDMWKGSNTKTPKNCVDIDHFNITLNMQSFFIFLKFHFSILDIGK